jgi:hypothetical protein
MSNHWIRIVNLLVAGVFPSTVAGDALGSHDCPHHDGLARHGEPAADFPAHDGHGDTGSDESHDDGPCSCVGECNITPGLAVVGVSSSRPNAATAIGTIIGPAAPPPARGPTPYLIPFANAPPA